jgi:hypothetical protein
MYCHCYSNTRGVTTLPPQRNLIPRLRRKRGSSENKEWSWNHSFGLNGTKVGVITFLIPRSGSCQLSSRSCRRKQASGWGQHEHLLLCDKDEGGCTKSLVKPQGQGSMITKTQWVRLVRVFDTPVILSRNKLTSDAHGNAGFQEGLTLR